MAAALHGTPCGCTALQPQPGDQKPLIPVWLHFGCFALAGHQMAAPVDGAPCGCIALQAAAG
eukprot:11166690-Lingulodinium_polyedra.AAC.1